MKEKSILTIICALILLIAFCSCGKRTKELNDIDVTSIQIVFDYDERSGAFDSKYYILSIVKSPNTSLEGYSNFSYFKERSSSWTIDPDGTRHFHSEGGDYVVLRYDISVFNDTLRTIKNGSPSIYTGPESDSNKQFVYKTLPFMIILNGVDKDGNGKIVYIDDVKNYDVLLQRVEELKQ